MDQLFGLLTTAVPIWVVLAWWLVINPAIEAMPEPMPSGSMGYAWFYKFANGVAGNFAEVMKHSLPGK